MIERWREKEIEFREERGSGVSPRLETWRERSKEEIEEGVWMVRGQRDGERGIKR